LNHITLTTTCFECIIESVIIVAVATYQPIPLPPPLPLPLALPLSPSYPIDPISSAFRLILGL